MAVTRKFLVVAALLTPLAATPALAGPLDWWLTPDQQGRWFFERKDYLKASRAFVNPLWKAHAYYRAGDFSNAAALFATLDTAEGEFYLGNSLAKQEKLAEAVAAYRRALQRRPEFPEAAFNLDWVAGLLELAEKEYDDAGGTGGKLGADRIVFSDRAAKAQGEMTTQEAQVETGLSENELREMWMRRVQTTPGDFLRLKFSYQLNRPDTPSAETESGTQ